MKKNFILTLICIQLFSNVLSQNKTITGKVIDYMGMPVAGVNVVDKDYPALMTITGVDGQFRLVVYNFTKVLKFNFAGMRTKEVTIGESKQLLVIMEYLPGKNPYPWHYSFYAQFGPSNLVTPIKNNNGSWSCSGAPGANLSFGVDYFFSQNIGISTGIGINTYNAKAWLNNFSNFGVNSILKIDKDNDTLYLYNTVTNLDERTKVSTISLPVKLKYRFRPGKKWDYFVDGGIKIMFVNETKIKANGQCYWQGYYPKYHAVISDIPEYGYMNYQINSQNTIPGINKLIFSFDGSIGISRSLGKKAYLNMGINYEHGLSDLNYRTPAYQADYLNTLGTPDKTFVRALRIIIGFSYNVIKKKQST